jgi:hypothetical protein
MNRLCEIPGGVQKNQVDLSLVTHSISTLVQKSTNFAFRAKGDENVSAVHVARKATALPYAKE